MTTEHDLIHGPRGSAYWRLDINLIALIGSVLTAFSVGSIARDTMPLSAADQFNILVAGPLTGLSFVGIRKLLVSISVSDHSYTIRYYRSVEDRLDELECLKRRDMVTPEEYAAKRQDILKDL